MAALDDRSVYREILDRLADPCMNGQGQISSRRVVEGVWHRHVESLVRSDTPEWMRESAQNSAREMKAANDLLAGLDATERQTLARLLAEQLVNGVHEALVIFTRLRFHRSTRRTKARPLTTSLDDCMGGLGRPAEDARARSGDPHSH